MGNWEQGLEQAKERINVLKSKRVAVYGLPGPENQVTRGITKYGMTAFAMEDSDPLPRDNYDAVVLSPIQVSHGRYAEIKKFCNDNKIKLFVTTSGFSQIKQAFEDHFFSDKVLRKVNIKKRNSSKKELVSKSEEKNTESNRITGPRIVKYTAEQRELRDEMILECVDAGFDNKQIIEYLTGEGYFRPSDGQPYTTHNIDQMKHVLHRKMNKESSKLLNNTNNKVKKDDRKVNKVAKKTTSKKRTPKNLGSKLDAVMEREDLSPEEKLSLIAKIRNGETETSYVASAGTYQGTPVIELYEHDVVTGNKKMIFGLGARKARAVVACIGEITAWVKTQKG